MSFYEFMCYVLIIIFVVRPVVNLLIDAFKDTWED